MKRDSGPGAVENEPHLIGQVLARAHARDAVDMAGDDMAAQFVADLQRAFQIDARAVLPVAHIGETDRLGRGIDREPGASAIQPVSTTVRQIAGAGDRGADRDRGAVVAARNGDAAQTRLPAPPRC